MNLQSWLLGRFGCGMGLYGEPEVDGSGGGGYQCGMGLYGEPEVDGSGGGGYQYGTALVGEGNGIPLSNKIGARELTEIFLVISRMTRTTEED